MLDGSYAAMRRRIISPISRRFASPSIETVTALKLKQTINGLLDLWWQEAKATLMHSLND
jgi:hypothetical protein